MIDISLLLKSSQRLQLLIEGIHEKETVKAWVRTVSEVKPILERELNQTLTNEEAQSIVRQFIHHHS